MKQKNTKLSLTTLIVLFFSTNIHTMDKNKIKLRRHSKSSEALLKYKSDSTSITANTKIKQYKKGSQASENLFARQNNPTNKGLAPNNNNLDDDTTIVITKTVKRRKRPGLTKTQKCLIGLGFTIIALNTAALALDGYGLVMGYQEVRSIWPDIMNFQQNIINASQELSNLGDAITLIKSVLATCPQGQTYLKNEFIKIGAQFLQICNCSFPGI